MADPLWSAGARGFSAGNVASLSTGAFTISGTDRYLEILAYSGAGTPQNVSAAAWDAAGANEALGIVEPHITSNTYFRSSKWALTNPTAGTSKVVTVTWVSNQDETMVIADSFVNVDQTTPTRTRPTPSQTSTSTPSLSVTSVAGDLVVGAVAFNDLATGGVTTISSSAVTIREKIENTDIGGYESCAQGDVTATGTSTSVGFTCNSGGNYYPVLFGVALIPSAGGGAPTTTVVTGSATASVGIPEPYLYKLDADPGASTVNVTPTAPVAGSFSASPLALTTSNWNTGLSSSLTASAAGSGNVSSTNDGGLTNGNLAVTVHPVARPSAVTAGTYTDETGAALVFGKLADGSDTTGAKDAAGADYTALLFDLSAIKSAGPQIAYFRGKEFAPGKRWRQVYYGADGVTVVGTGGWKTMTSTVAQYSDSLTLTGDAYKGQIQKQSNVGGSNSLSFPSNVTGSDTAAPFVALQFLNPQSDGLPIWGTGSGASRLGVTYIWRYRPRQQTGYYVNFWWSNNGSFLWDGGGSNTYYGGHPYPQSSSNIGTTHYWEIGGGSSGSDTILTLAGTPRTVVKDVWYTQALRVIVNGDGSKTLRYYLDLPNLANTDIIQMPVLSTWGETNPPSPALTWGDSPWYASFQHERLSGELDSLKIVAKGLSEADTVSEAGDMSTMVTTDGGNYVWYSKNGFDSVDDLTCPYTSRTPVWADTGNKATLGDRP